VKSSWGDLHHSQQVEKPNPFPTLEGEKEKLFFLEGGAGNLTSLDWRSRLTDLSGITMIVLLIKTSLWARNVEKYKKILD
jgi:hypothetical protein